MFQPATINQKEPRQSGLIERRAWVRFPCNKETFCHPLLTETEILWPGKILNLSAGGMGLLLTRRFEQGTLLEVGIRGGSRPLMVEVLHVSSTSQGGWVIGGVFANPLTDEEVTTLLK